jgi:hypothetical protein
VEAEIVPLDVPFLVGLDVLVRHELEIDISGCKLIRNGPSESLIRFRGHLVYQWLPSLRQICFTKLELYRAHRSFAHTSPGKLYRLLLRARPDQAPPQLLAELQQIADRCRTCQKFAKKPLRFMAAFPTEYGLGEEISVDLLNLNAKTALYVVDSCTK